MTPSVFRERGSIHCTKTEDFRFKKRTLSYDCGENCFCCKWVVSSALITNFIEGDAGCSKCTQNDIHGCFSTETFFLRVELSPKRIVLLQTRKIPRYSDEWPGSYKQFHPNPQQPHLARLLTSKCLQYCRTTLFSIKVGPSFFV